ncbi:Na+/H+ antiporter subunit E [Lutibaculum baratangense]|uniref:Na+/H+ antiporter subunit E n=1 Tax=Lutibaculum baratangense TaxID=1358440 RepID=UPI000416AEB3|nr:Na+/H+ antiporter subunit E [Lutibaculum baratangense]
MGIRGLSLIAALFAFWLLLSGHYDTWLVSVGFVCSALVGAFMWRLKVLDQEGYPAGFLVGAVTYWPWLAWEIVKSALDVTKEILKPRLEISPTVVRVTASQKTSVGFTTYANSITLTPGTISTTVSFDDHTILVHALTREGADATAEGTMDRRVSRFESGL